MSNKVFVYGSLKKGYGNHSFLEGTGAKFLGPYVTPPEYKMVSCGGFPGVLKDGNTPITGEVYEVDDAVFASLDRLEGNPDFYKRELISTPYGDAWVYIIHSSYSTRPPVEDGNSCLGIPTV